MKLIIWNVNRLSVRCLLLFLSPFATMLGSRIVRGWSDNGDVWCITLNEYDWSGRMWCYVQYTRSFLWWTICHPAWRFDGNNHELFGSKLQQCSDILDLASTTTLFTTNGLQWSWIHHKHIRCGKVDAFCKRITPCGQQHNKSCHISHWKSSMSWK
jgi:hypothetical protein